MIFFCNCAFCENRKKVCFFVLVTMHSGWQWTIYSITRIIFPHTLTEGIGEENGAEKEKNDRGQRRRVSGAFARKPNRLPRDCGTMANSWLANGQKNRSSTRFRFDWGYVLSIFSPYDIRMYAISSSLLAFLRSLTFARDKQGRNKRCKVVSRACEIFAGARSLTKI